MLIQLKLTFVTTTRLSTSHGFEGISEVWLQSFSDEKKMMLTLGLNCFEWEPVLFGVLHGSILLPLLYMQYTTDLPENHRIWIPCPSIRSSFTPALGHWIRTAFLRQCWIPWLMNTVQGKISLNRLRCNLAKTTPNDRNLTDAISNWRRRTAVIPGLSLTTLVHDLGVWINGEIFMADHLNSICMSCLNRLRQNRWVQRNLSFDAASALLHSFVLTRLDYCNFIFAGLPKLRLRQLQPYWTAPLS